MIRKYLDLLLRGARGKPLSLWLGAFAAAAGAAFGGIILGGDSGLLLFFIIISAELMFLFCVLLFSILRSDIDALHKDIVVLRRDIGVIYEEMGSDQDRITKILEAQSRTRYDIEGVEMILKDIFEKVETRKATRPEDDADAE